MSSGNIFLRILIIQIAANSDTRHRYADLKPRLDTISTYASKYGLSAPTLKQLVDAITSPNSFDQSIQNALIQCLYPNSKVPSDTIYRMVGSLGHGKLKASLSTQQGLLKWLIMIYDTLEDPGVLSQMYSVFFNLLDTFSLRADLCYLLAKITEKKHVKMFRVQMLRDISRTVGQDSALVKLMIVYDGHVPGQFDLASSKKRITTFRHPDPEWRERLEQIQNNSNNHSTEHLLSDDPFNKTTPKSTLISADTSRTSETIDDIMNGLCAPSPAELTISDLLDSKFQLQASLKPESIIAQQLDSLLSSLLQHHLKKTEHAVRGNPSLPEILEATCSLTDSIKVQWIWSHFS